VNPPDRPLVPPLPVADWDPELQPIAGHPDAPGGGTLNVFATLAHHPKLMKRWLVFGNHVMAKSTLPARDRELLILRTGWNCGSPYEWGQHVAIARQCGLTDDEIAAVAYGPGADGWSDHDAMLLRAADELHEHACVGAITWRAIEQQGYSEQQLLDLVFTVGQYHLVAMALNSCRVERDDGVDPTSVPFPVHPDDAGERDA
jgi:alkylhydroperoxidase family enzyme